jgi:hypothetical protein
MRKRCYAAHALHAVQQQALADQDRMYSRFHFKSSFSGLHGIPVLLMLPENGSRLPEMKYFAGDFYTSQHTGLLDLQNGFAPGIGWNGTQGGVIPIAGIFFKCGSDQFV